MPPSILCSSKQCHFLLIVAAPLLQRFVVAVFERSGRPVVLIVRARPREMRCSADFGMPPSLLDSLGDCRVCQIILR